MTDNRTDGAVSPGEADYKEAEKLGLRPDGRVVLCGANAYEQKYYFNPIFRRIPESIREELRIICVLFTQEAGGVFTIEFEEDGEIFLRTECDEEDITWDSVSAGLLSGEIRRRRGDLLDAVSLYYRATILHEDMSALLSEDDD
ncbi:MAG: DUF6145 family protein [Lachnospiraceae bacterium]|nr:DUF6145 family protein [Lachnospiraceae bacterium]